MEQSKSNRTAKGKPDKGRAVNGEMVEESNYVSGQIRRSVVRNIVSLVASSMAAEVQANYSKSFRRQAFDPAPSSEVARKTDANSVQQNDCWP
jgi:hypothetical protein